MAAITFEQAAGMLDTFHARLLESFGADTPPPELFHYTSAAGLRGILSDKSFRATDVACMNDTSEAIYSRGLVIEALQDRTDFLSQEIVRIFKDAEGLLNLGRAWFVYVACFCAEPDLLSQWRGYTKSGDGFAIGIPPQAFRRAGTDYALIKVVYDRETQKKAVIALVDHALSVFEKYAPKNEDESNRLFGVVGTKLLGCLLDFKHPAFQEESEWRLLVIQHDDQEHEARVRYRAGTGAIIPYVEVSFEIGSISRIVVGPGAVPKFNLLTVQRLLKSLGCPTVPVESSRIPLL